MTSDGVITITDPVRADLPRHPILARLVGKHVRDPGDLPFVRLSITLAVIFIPLATCMFIPSLFSWWLAAAYWALYLFMLPPFILMLHCTSHRPLYRDKNGLGSKIIPWINGPLLGMSPETYFAHHIGMHHVEGNLPDDLSSTMRYQRDSFLHFLRYFGRFFFLGDYEVIQYFRKRGRTRMLKRFVVGELAFIAVAALAVALNWRAGLVVFVVPMVMTRFLLMMGNWAQHAFIDPDHPTDDFRTVVSFINSGYNKRCFNDGYHLGHHIKASRHWLDYPTDFLERRAELADKGALVFEKLEYTAIFILLMFKRYRFMARFYVQLDPENPLSEDEIVALLKRRVARFTPEQLDALRKPAPGAKADPTAAAA